MGGALLGGRTGRGAVWRGRVGAPKKEEKDIQ